MKYPLEPRGELTACLCRGSVLLEKEKPFSKELSDSAVPAHVSSSSSWPLIPVSCVLIDCFERCKAQNRLDPQFSALRVVYCIALKLEWRFSKEIGVWKSICLAYISCIMPQELIYCMKTLPNTSLETCTSLTGGWTIPHPCKCSMSDWMRPWAAWPSAGPLCPWQGSSN